MAAPSDAYDAAPRPELPAATPPEQHGAGASLIVAAGIVLLLALALAVAGYLWNRRRGRNISS